MVRRGRKLKNKIVNACIKPLSYLDNNLYMKLMNKHLKRIGIRIKGDLFYIHPTVYFDGSDYSLISIGDGTSISKNVSFLTHDFSANTVYKGLNLPNENDFDEEYKINRLRTLKPITIGEHTFIGANAFILPGTKIGSNCIIGAGGVVRGTIPDNSIALGNPAVVVKNTSQWLLDKMNRDGEFR